jgi:nucleoside phosphorylase
MTDKEFFNILIVVPLEEELVEVMTVFPGIENRSTETSFRYTVDPGVDGLRVLVVQQDGMGKAQASHAVKDALKIYDVGTIVCIGIAGSLTGDLRLCDVCYSEDILDVTDNAKVEDIESGMDIALSPTYYETPAEFAAAINFSRLFPELRPGYLSWQEECEAFVKTLIPFPVIERDGKEQMFQAPKSKNGMIACGLVTKSARYNAKVLGVERKTLAIETESGGIFDEGKRAGVPCVTFRGISDHADKNKGKLEDETGAKVRRVAALNAARFFKLQLKNPFFISALNKACENRQLPLELGSRLGFEPIRDLTKTIALIDDLIEVRLRELSPEFRLQIKGYRLPVPRIRDVHYASGLGHNFKSDPIELRQALEAENVVLLSLSRTYPDYSLPWVMGKDLLTAEIGGKQAIPIVVNGERIRPPQGGLTAASEFPFEVPEDVEGTQVVYIINEIPLESQTRIRFLESEIKRRPDAKFVIITRNETNLVAESDFSSAIGASFYHLAGVSFLEIAHFVQKNFEITASEAEVIALRLRDTFRHFDLSAHPTYFAGISKEVLTSLLQANRRAELIQLAVDGFLTFVVAGDKAKVKLSRTTRAKFLRTIASEIHLEKRNFGQADLIEFAKSFADLKDFEIDPISFVGSFVDSGVLHFENDIAHFSLPFIESYLLAVELVENPDKAKSYFDLSEGIFDVSTFDLYAELGASPDVVNIVINAIEVSTANFALNKGERHALLRDDVRPSSMRSLRRLDGLQKSMQRTADDVRQGKGNIERKQKVLDVADRVRETAADKSGFGRREVGATKSDAEMKVSFAMKSWAVGTTLLGAGAEELSGDVKQRLAQMLIELGNVIIHHWTLANASVDFEQIKVDLTSDDSLAELVGESGNDVSEMKQKIEGVVDILEFAFLAEPTRRILGHLCESARQKVLAVSVERAKPEGLMNKLIHGAWLADIESERGEKLLSDAAKSLPKAPFLRVVLATHLLTRVYWNQWRKDDRLKLLDLAAEVVKPLIQLDKAKIQRIVRKEPGSATRKRDIDS